MSGLRFGWRPYLAAPSSLTLHPSPGQDVALRWSSRLTSYQWTRRIHEQRSGALIVCQAMFVAALTLKKRQEARQDETGAEVPDAIYPMMRGEIVVQTLD